MPLIRSNNIHTLEKFVDRVRISGKVTGQKKRWRVRRWNSSQLAVEKVAGSPAGKLQLLVE